MITECYGFLIEIFLTLCFCCIQMVCVIIRLDKTEYVTEVKNATDGEKMLT